MEEGRVGSTHLKKKKKISTLAQDCIFNLFYIHICLFWPWSPHPQAPSSPTEFKIRYWWSTCAQPPSILMGYWWREWIPALGHHESAAVRETAGCWRADIIKRGYRKMLFSILHTHRVKKKKEKSMKAHTNACCGYTLPAALHICASTPTAHWDGESSPKEGGGGHGLPHGHR